MMSSPVTVRSPASPSSHVGGAEPDLGVLLGVEELRALEVAVEVLVLAGDARDPGRALDRYRAVLLADEADVVVAEAAAIGRDAVVLDVKLDPRVDGVDAPGAGRCSVVSVAVLIVVSFGMYLVASQSML